MGDEPESAELKNHKILKKVTLNYSRVQDRIRMDALSDCGNTYGFWLTQRLCRQLVAALLEHFHHQTAAQTPANPQAVASVQSFKQQQAKVMKRPSVAVPTTKATAETALLLEKVQIRTSDDTVMLLLPLLDGQSGLLPFSSNQARQWLDVIYRQYKVADWSLEIWPQWIAESARQASTYTRAAKRQEKKKLH